MKRSLVSVAILFAITLSSAPLLAQGSIYNLVGFGSPVTTPNPAMDAMGGVGAALGGGRTINNLNPADWSWLERARFETAFAFRYTDDQLDPDRATNTAISFNGFTFAVPFYSEYRATLSLGYEPLTNASARIQASRDGADQTFISKGGANVAYLGASVRPLAWLGVGASFQYILGNIRHPSQVNFNDATAQPGEFERDYLFNGIRPQIGLQIVGDSMSAGMSGWMFGLAITPGTTLSASKETIVTPVTTTLDTTLSEGGSGYYPSSLTAGLSWHSTGRLRVEADYAMESYGSAYVYSTTNTNDPALRNSTRVGAGIERVPNMNGEYGTAFGLDRWALRLGLYFSQLPFQPSGTGGLSEFAGTAGVGIPISFESMINLSLAVGQRQPANAGSAPKELFLRLGANLSLSDRWFVPTRRDD